MPTGKDFMKMLDWNNPKYVQECGRDLAYANASIYDLLQPNTPELNKNIWENCALVIARKTDSELEPYITELLEWLQDMNWPGAFCVLHRLGNFKRKTSLNACIEQCICKAKEKNDIVWEINLHLLKTNDN